MYDLGIPGPMRDRLVAAVVQGDKRATSSLRLDYDVEHESLPVVGTRHALMDGAGRRLGVVEVTSVEVLRLGDVGDDIAHAEGEGFADVAAWREAHEGFWTDSVPGIREYLRDPDWALNDDTEVVVEHFALVG